MIYFQITSKGYDVMIEFKGETYKVGYIEEDISMFVFRDKLFTDDYFDFDSELELIKDCAERFYSGRDTTGRIEEKYM